MKWLEWLEKRFGQYAIPNLTLWLVAAQGFVYIATRAGGAGAGGPLGGLGGLSGRLELVPALVMEGEVWRLFTFPMVPPGFHPIIMLIYLSAFYFFGGAVESVWGAFRYNAYLLLGFAFTAVASFAEPHVPAYGASVKWSVFLAFATLFPDYVIRLYGILPIKAKFLAAFTWAQYVVSFWYGGLSTRLIIGAAVGNYFLFFGASAWRGVKQAKRRRDFKRRADSAAKAIMHECCVCGITSQMAPKMRFRYRSEDGESRCYCLDCLKDLERVAAE